MMKTNDDYVSRSNVIKAVCKFCVLKCAKTDECFCRDTVIRDIPAADVRPVIHGEWIYGSSDDAWCSVCGEIFNDFDCHVDQYNFCPNCGADMREVE